MTDLQAIIKDEVVDELESIIHEEQYKRHQKLLPWTPEKRTEFGSLLETPEGIEQLIRDDYFLGWGDRIYDSILQDVTDLFMERKKRDINLAIFISSIGAGKSCEASIILWLTWLELVCYGDPQKYFDLGVDSVIAFIILSRTAVQARKVAFNEVWNRFQSPFNKDYFPASPRYRTEIIMERNNIVLFPGTSSALSALGYNLYGGIVDEANFLEVVEDSKRAAMEDRYEAAEDMYNAITNRMVSRFMKAGKLPGLLAMISSPRYPTDFLERKVKEAIDLGKLSNVFFRKRTLWEAKGKKFYPSNQYFYINTETLEEVNPGRAEKLIKLKNMLSEMRGSYDKKFARYAKYGVRV